MISIGAASRVINNDLGTPIQGASVNRVVRAIRDDLEANALFLATDRERILLISCDVVGLEQEPVRQFCEAIQAATDVPARSVLIGVTHTHSGPSLIPTCYRKPVDSVYLERLGGWLVEVAREAVAAARPAQVGWGVGTARIGYNRRVCWKDGRHTMHGDLHSPEAMGLEGPDDPAHMALFVRDATGKVIAILHHNTSHPTCWYGEDVLSADFPGVARAQLRDALGKIPVLFFNGALGDISIESQSGGSESRAQKASRAGWLVAGETLRLLHEAEFHAELELAHVWEDLTISVRLPPPAQVARAREVLARVEAGAALDSWEVMNAHGPVLLQERFGNNPRDTLTMHALRIGDVALVTQPCELYCQFGLDMKRRSPSPLTVVCGLVGGYAGYCPTQTAILGGGYSADPMYWVRLEPEAGCRLVELSSKLLRQLWPPARNCKDQTCQ